MPGQFHAFPNVVTAPSKIKPAKQLLNTIASEALDRFEVVSLFRHWYLGALPIFEYNWYGAHVIVFKNHMGPHTFVFELG